MRKLALTLVAAAAAAVVLPLTLSGSALAQPPAAQAPAAEPAKPAGPKEWEIAADAKPLAKQEIEGMVIEDFVIGTGAECKPNTAVVAFYHGTLKADGKVFDSAFERGDPIAFPLAGVIPGWQKGVPGMKVGGLRRLTIPYALAYGEQGRPPTIPAKADLVFVIKLVDTITIEDTVPGTGEEASAQCVPVTKHTIKTKDGETVENTGDKLYVWLPREMMGIDFGVTGMKVGGKRKITVPAKMAATNPGLGTSRPSEKDFIIELELVAVRNLPAGPGGR